MLVSARQITAPSGCGSGNRKSDIFSTPRAYVTLDDTRHPDRCQISSKVKATVVVGEKGSDVEKVEFGSRADPRGHRGGRCEFDPAHWNRGGESRRHNGGRRPDARRVLSALSQQG